MTRNTTQCANRSSDQIFSIYSCKFFLGIWFSWNNTQCNHFTLKLESNVRVFSPINIKILHWYCGHLVVTKFTKIGCLIHQLSRAATLWKRSRSSSPKRFNSSNRPNRLRLQYTRSDRVVFVYFERSIDVRNAPDDHYHICPYIQIEKFI